MGQLSPNAMNVQGTGQNVGELKNLGYSQGDISSLGGGTPNVWQKLVKGGATGLANGLQSYGQPQARGQNNLNFYGYGS